MSLPELIRFNELLDKLLKKTLSTAEKSEYELLCQKILSTV